MYFALCDHCESFDHNNNNCSYHDYMDPIRECLGKTANKMNDKMIETMKERITEYLNYFNQNKNDYNEHNSSLWSTRPKISLFGDFEPSYLGRHDLRDDISFPSLEQGSDHSVSLSPNLNLNLACLEMSLRMS